MPRPLPTAEEAARILSMKRTRPAGRPPPAAGRALAGLIKTLDQRFGQGSEGLKARWREIVGETLARRTEPVKLTRPRGAEGQVLELKVDGPSAAIVQHQASDILQRVNLVLGAGAVTRLRIVQGPVRAAARSEPTPAAVRRRRATPLDAAAEAELARSLETLPEGGLKQALARLGREVMRGRP